MHGMFMASMLVAFMMSGVARADGDAEPARDCSIYSLEGVRIGMTLDEVRAAQPGAEFSQVGKNDRSAKLQNWRVRRKWKREAPGVSMLITLTEGRVIQVRNHYLRLEGALSPTYTPTVSPEVLRHAFIERFGPEDSSTVRNVDLGGGTSEVYTARLWSDESCDRFLSLNEGKRITALMGTVVESPILDAVLSKNSALEAAADAEAAAGVRF